MSFIKGNFKKYIFKSDKGYTVGLFKIKDASEDIIEHKNESIIFTGYFPNLNESDLYLLNGNFISHPKYGEQFETNSYEIVLPEDKDNIVEFLSSDLFPKIGEKKAIKIVDHLGENTLEIILNDPNRLLSIPTITEKQKNILHDNLKKYQSSYLTIVELTKYGFNTKDALIIYNHFKDKTLDILKENPYIISDNIKEISFKKIDSKRSNLNILDDDKRRISSSIKYVLNEIANTLGNTYSSYEEIVYYTKRYLFNVEKDKIEKEIDILLETNEIIKIEDKYMLYDYYEKETYIATRIYSLANKTKQQEIEKDCIDEIENSFEIEFNNDQKKAIKESLKNNFCVITGGPGTGKTTIIKAICKLYQKINRLDDKNLIEKLYLLAPTGRASKRMSEETMLPAYTIHRFLKWNKEDNSFRINEENKSTARIVIIDESSMIDTNLLYNLLLGLEYDTKIILIGDYNQLPSVGAGQIFKDIIESDCVNVIKLEKLYRQAANSNINLFAHDILKEKMNLDLFDQEELTFIEANNENLKEKLEPLVQEYSNYDINKFQILAPIYKGDNGIDNLNYFLQEIINKKTSKVNETLVDGVTIREKDKILQLINDPDNNVFNGDIGEIVKINNNKKEIIIDFNDNLVTITPSNYQNIKLGYVISIHKSQGSEFDIVIIVVLNSFNNMLYKKLIYTAVTRAKKKLILIGELSALEKAIKNNRENNRKTNLKNFILDCIKIN